MKKLIFNVSFAAFGFLLSLIVGIVSPVTIGVTLIRAFIFAAIFAAISVGLQILFKTVLSTSEEQGDGLAADGDAKNVGSVVDITLPDEDLPTDEDAPRFYVGASHHMLNESDYNRPVVLPEQKQAAAVSAGKNDVPASAQSPVQNNPVGFTPASLENVAQSNANPSGMEDLPSIKDFNIGNDDDGSAIVEDTDLTEEEQESAYTPPVMNSAPPKNVSANIDNKDTVLMARAISTVLANDS